MIVRFSFYHPRLNNYAIELPSYQWGYTTNVDYLFRAFGTSPAGTHFREGLSIERRWMTLRFVADDATIQKIQTFSFMVQRFVRDVSFWPDYAAAPGTSWIVDWEAEVAFARATDNRQEIELRVVEASPGGTGGFP